MSGPVVTRVGLEKPLCRGFPSHSTFHLNCNVLPQHKPSWHSRPICESHFSFSCGLFFLLPQSGLPHQCHTKVCVFLSTPAFCGCETLGRGQPEVLCNIRHLLLLLTPKCLSSTCYALANTKVHILMVSGEEREKHICNSAENCIGRSSRRIDSLFLGWFLSRFAS